MDVNSDERWRRGICAASGFLLPGNPLSVVFRDLGFLCPAAIIGDERSSGALLAQ